MSVYITAETRFMPSVLRDATIQPIPKGSKNPSLSANYRGIAFHLLSVKFLSGLFVLPGVNTSSPVVYNLASNRASLPPCVLVP